MTRKDYQLIAGVIRQSLDDYKDIPGLGVDNDPERGAILFTADALADELAADNLMFDRDKFLKACGINRELS